MVFCALAEVNWFRQYRLEFATLQDLGENIKQKYKLNNHHVCQNYKLSESPDARINTSMERKLVRNLSEYTKDSHKLLFMLLDEE